MLAALSMRHIARCSPSFAQTYCTPPPYPSLLPDIAFEELSKKLESKQLVLLDVRTPVELEKRGFVPGAINLPLQSLGHLILLPKEDFAVRIGVTKPTASSPLVTMCRGGVRARTAQLALLGAGYSNVRRYLGSFDDWEEKGGPIIKPTEDDLS